MSTSRNSDIRTIESYLRDQERKLYNLEHHINRMTQQFGKREKLLLSEIAKLHNELRDQTIKFQEKFYDDYLRRSSVTTLSLSSSSYNELPPVEEEGSTSEEADETAATVSEEGETFYVHLKRAPNGSLGFNVVGGSSAEPDCDQGVYVSRIWAESPEPTKALQPYDRILKVNGRDVSRNSHHDVVDALEKADEPIVVQICRRLNSSSKIRREIRHSDMSLMTTSTQTDPIAEEDEDDLANGETTALLPRKRVDDEGEEEEENIFAGNSNSSQGVMAQLELSVDGFIDDTDLDDECRRQLYDVEYEEVTLRRSTDGEKLGLTLCYGTGDNVDTDIFVGEIEPRSVADKDGRIKAGDQILQINGVDVHTRNRAIELFGGRENADITLLLARNSNGESLRDVVRPVARLEVETIEEERSVMQDQVFEEDDGVLTDGTRGSAGSAHEKDSGISRTTDSEPDLPPPINSSPSKYSQSSAASSIRSGASCTGKEISTPENNATTTNNNSSTLTSLGGVDNQRQLRRSDSESSLERELHNLHREMEFIQLECDRLIEQHAKAERQVRQQMDQANKLAATMDNFQKQQLFVDTKEAAKNRLTTKEETSSAYNTGNESCRSTPLTLTLNDVVVQKLSAGASSSSSSSSRRKFYRNPASAAIVDQNEYETIADEDDGKRDSAVFTLPSRNSSSSKLQQQTETSLKNNCDNNNKQQQLLLTNVGVLSPKVKNDCRQLKQSSSSTGDLNGGFSAGEIMYTNPENLQQTILLQQRLLRQAMIQQAHHLKAQQAFGRGPVPFFQNCFDANTEEFVRLEWKVKRRSDGSRYITRRPVRNKILKERAQQLTNERVGVSTDDDAMSELKIGKYWTKEERKKHLERARERKKRQEELIKRQNEALQQSNDQPILHLSHKKMMRRQGQQLFDKFTTVQEFLSHGARTVDTKRAFGLLSVTTV